MGYLVLIFCIIILFINNFSLRKKIHLLKIQHHKNYNKSLNLKRSDSESEELIGELEQCINELKLCINECNLKKQQANQANMN